MSDEYFEEIHIPTSSLEPEQPPTLDELFAELELHQSKSYIQSVAQRAARIANESTELLPWLQSKNRACRLAAIRAIGDFNSPIDDGIVENLKELAEKEEDTATLCATIETLGKLQITDAAEVITHCLDDGNERIVPPAALALSRLGVRSVAQRLRYLLQYGKPAMVSSAARGLALLSATEAVPDLIDSLQQSPAIQSKSKRQKWIPATRKIIEALGELKAYGAVDILRQISRDHIGLRSPAFLSLHGLGEDITGALIEAYQIQPTRNLYKVAIKTGLAHHVDDMPSPIEFRRALELEAASADPRLVRNQERLEDTPDLLTAGQTVSVDIEHVDDGFVIGQYQGLSVLLPSYEISWGRVATARDHLSDNEQIDVKVISVDAATGKVLVSRRELLPDPWIQMAQRIPVGTRLHGEVTGVTPFGVFVEVMPNIEGLLHRSQFPNEQVDRDEVQNGQAISVVIAAIDSRARKITLRLPPK